MSDSIEVLNYKPPKTKEEIKAAQECKLKILAPIDKNVPLTGMLTGTVIGEYKMRRIHELTEAELLELTDGIGIVLGESRTNVAGEEARSARSNRRKTEPSDFSTNDKFKVSWEEWYRRLWKFKILCWEKNHG